VNLSLKMRAYLLLLAVVCVWGATFVLVKTALADISPTLFNLVRMALACGALFLAYRPHLKRLTGRQWAAGAVTGACLTVGYQFQTIGLRYTTPSKSGFITGILVVLVPLLSAIPWLRTSAQSKPDLRSVLGAVIAFAGLALLTVPTGADAGNMLRSINPGDWLTLGCAVGFALHILTLSKATRVAPYQVLAIMQTGFAALFLTVCLPVFERPYFHATPRLAFALAITAFLATAVAFSVQSWAQGILPATNTAILLTMEPVFAWITSFLVLGERLGGRGMAGAGLVLAGILFTELRARPEIPPSGAA
jgi:drug/metabolite transporter (DMT)-like permease